MPSRTGGAHFLLKFGSLLHLGRDLGDAVIVAGGEIHEEVDVPIVDVVEETEEEGGG